MTDATTPPEMKERSVAKRVVMVAIAVVVALLAAVFVISRTGLDKAVLRQRLDTLATTLAEQGRAQGRDIQLHYQDVEIHGGFGSRHAVIIAPEFSIRPLPKEGQTANPADQLRIRTADIAVYPKAVDLSKLRIVADKPIDFYDASNTERKLLSITANAPFTTDVAQHQRAQVEYLEISQAIPANIAFTYLREQQAQGEEDAAQTVVPVYETLGITQAEGGLLYADLARDGSGLGNARLLMKELTFTPAAQPDAVIHLAEINTDWSHDINDKKHHVVTANLHVGDVTAAPELLPYAPIGLTMAIHYEGAAPQKAQDVASTRTQESSFKLDQFSLTTKDAALHANADFVASPTDVLPVGSAHISLSNVPFVAGELRQYGLLNSGNEPLVADILGLVTGQPFTALHDADIEINRARGGAFAIGKTTFEELFAVVLKHSITKASPSVVPLPAPDSTPQPAKKIQVEEGARG